MCHWSYISGLALSGALADLGGLKPSVAAPRGGMGMNGGGMGAPTAAGGVGGLGRNSPMMPPTGATSPLGSPPWQASPQHQQPKPSPQHQARPGELCVISLYY